MDEILGDGWKCGGEVEQYARSILMHKGSMHGGGVHIHQVSEDGAAPQKALLSRQDPFVECRLPSQSCRVGHDSIVSVDNA